MKVLFIDSVHPILQEKLEARKFVCEFDYQSSPEKILEKIAEYEGIVIRSRFKLNDAFLSKAQNLRFIARSGSGLENIDLESCKKYGIEVINSPEGNKDAVAEHALGMLLNLFNHINKADREVRNDIWDREGNRGIEIMGKTIGIIGYGVMGSAFAQRLQGFECRVIAYDKYKSGFGNSLVEEVGLGELKEESDVISLNLPYSLETHYFINQDFLESCKKDFYLINTARGQHVNLNDLVKGLKSGKVKGACLDVLEYEKSSFEKLKSEDLPESWQFLKASDKVVLSPHVAGWTYESYVKLSEFLALKILALY